MPPLEREPSLRALGGLLPAMGIGLRWYFLAALLMAAVAFGIAAAMPDTALGSTAMGWGCMSLITTGLIVAGGWKMYHFRKQMTHEAARKEQEAQARTVAQIAEAEARAAAQIAEAEARAAAQIRDASSAADRAMTDAERKEREAEAAKQAALLQVQAKDTIEELDRLKRLLRDNTAAAVDVAKRQRMCELELEARDVIDGELYTQMRGNASPIKATCTLRVEREFSSAAVQWNYRGWVRTSVQSYPLTATSLVRFDGEDDGGTARNLTPGTTDAAGEDLRTKAATAAEAQARAAGAVPEERKAQTAEDAEKPPQLIVETKVDGNITPLYLSAPPELTPAVYNH